MAVFVAAERFMAPCMPRCTHGVVFRPTRAQIDESAARRVDPVPPVLPRRARRCNSTLPHQAPLWAGPRAELLEDFPKAGAERSTQGGVVELVVLFFIGL